MKSVGKQLQEARQARNWTPELAARETKIKVDRLRDLESDDYSHFTSPTYARGFVRTYARALGLDEYRILRQLDNRLPDDDSANIVTDGGVAYLPETALPPRVAHRDFTGLYIVAGLGVLVTMAIVVILFEAYRVGELATYFGSGPETASTTNAAPAMATTDTPLRAKPLDSDTPPPVIAETNVAPTSPIAVVPVPASDSTSTAAVPIASTPGAVTNAPSSVAAVSRTLLVSPSTSDDSATQTGPVAPRALPVDPSVLGSTSGDPYNASDHVPVAPRALPVDPSQTTDTTGATSAAAPAPPLTPPNDSPAPAEKAPPRALPVNPNDPDAAGKPSAPEAKVALNTSATEAPVNGAPLSPDSTATTSTPSDPPAPLTPVGNATAQQTTSGPVVEPSPPAATDSPVSSPATTIAPTPSSTATDPGKRLVLIASQDSFVRVTNLDAGEADKPLYAAVLHGGQSVAFDGRKFSINVGIPSAVDIQLDGVNYGPHSEHDAPETFVVQSHLP